jgi:hypothetical protein
VQCRLKHIFLCHLLLVSSTPIHNYYQLANIHDCTKAIVNLLYIWIKIGADIILLTACGLLVAPASE